MKNLASILVFIFAFTLSTNAQRKGNKQKRERPQFTVAQQTDIALKKMTLALDLSNKQQNQLKPMIVSKIEARKAFMENRKQARQEKKKPSADEIYAIQTKRLDNAIAMKAQMKDILDKEQFAKFEKMQKKRKMMVKKKMQKNSKGKKAQRRGAKKEK
ncbi:hypothetical protein [uncultured Polaribacter sp.]|uniref:hypothetical protein n=1 Tax=uncultured Polaribacter sp. TaxID=174711 RepID=UPI00260EEE49|nr:hypothetical protein [uncultured Polaribacter sp.]